MTEEYRPNKKTKVILDQAWRHIQSVPYAVSLRWVFYRLLQDGLYRTKKDYKPFTIVTSAARKRFYEGWRPWTLADETREAVIRGDGFHSVETWLDGVRRVDCNLNKWDSQPYYIEIWFEAAAMKRQFEYYTQDIPLLAFRGQVSIPEKWKTAERIKEQRQKGKDVVILYFGDWDDAGIEIPDNALRDIEEWCPYDFDYTRCGLNDGDGQKLGLPQNPDKPGTYQWEALTDSQAQQLIESNVSQFQVLTKIQEIEARQKSAEQKFSDAMDKLIGDWEEGNDNDN